MNTTTTNDQMDGDDNDDLKNGVLITTTDSTNNHTQLATQVLKVELQQQIALLKDQLRESTLKLRQPENNSNNNNVNVSITNDGNGNDDDDEQHQQQELQKIPPLVSKRGYLFKWLDRTIGWSGTKWGLRFVVLNATQRSEERRVGKECRP